MQVVDSATDREELVRVEFEEQSIQAIQVDQAAVQWEEATQASILEEELDQVATATLELLDFATDQVALVGLQGLVGQLELLATTIGRASIRVEAYQAAIGYFAIGQQR